MQWVQTSPSCWPPVSKGLPCWASLPSFPMHTVPEAPFSANAHTRAVSGEAWVWPIYVKLCTYFQFCQGGSKKYAWGHAVIHSYIFYLLLVAFNGLNSICNSMLKCVRVVCYVPHAEMFVMRWLAMLLCLQTLTLPSSHRWVSPSYGSIQAAGGRFFCVVEVSQGYSWLCVPMHHCRRLVLLPWEHLKLKSKSLQLYVGWLCTSPLYTYSVLRIYVCVSGNKNRSSEGTE